MATITLGRQTGTAQDCELLQAELHGTVWLLDAQRKPVGSFKIKGLLEEFGIHADAEIRTWLKRKHLLP